MVQPIWQVFTDLGIEGEYCGNAVDAVEKVTTQMFQIVITDWEDQPEAGFLLKTARDLKASQRPLTLAIVSDDARLPEALQAGANSVLVKPLRAEQVRDTMSTACELLRAKQQSIAQPPPAPAAHPPKTAALAAAASATAVAVPASMPSSVTQAPEKTFRAGEFLHSPGSAPGPQFDTESEVQKSLDQAAAAEVDALTELEPMASAVEEAPAQPARPEEPPAAPQEPLTGWASLQARLTRSAPPPAEEAPAKSELLSYGDTPSYGSQAAGSPAEEGKETAKEESQPPAESESESALFAYMSRESTESSEPAEEPRSKRSKLLLVGILAAACGVLAAVPRTRQGMRTFYHSAVRAGGTWLNPPPAPLPQTATQHDSFGQEGDEYKLPTPANIPDAATDPSQIRVLPVVDPTAKPEKGADANSGQPQASTADSSPSDQGQPTPGQSAQTPAQAADNQPKDSTPTSATDTPGNAAVLPAQPPPAPPVQQNAPEAQAPAPQPHPVTTTHSSAPPAVSASTSAGIPSSLKSQMASSTPDASGNKPPEAAMSSIEPVSLPESAARNLLAQPVDPEYPAAAKASGQRGSVVLQVLIGRDGAVQDAKFLQGSLVFARAAIDAVKQWRFKPYSMNGRAVSVQTVVTLNFRPPA